MCYQAATGGLLSEHVDSVAGVGAAVLGVGIQDVQGDEAEIVGGSETMSLWNRLSIAKPLNLINEKQYIALN